MLALVTCHIFPPSIIRKKMNSWHLTSRLTARSFSECTASRVRSGRCPRQCATLLHGQIVFQEKKRLFCNLGAMTQNSWIRSIMSYLWMIGLEMRLFSCGPTFEDYPQVFSQKKVQPLGFYFWHLRLGLFKSLFLVGEAEHVCLYPFARTTVFSAKKRLFCNLGALTKFLNSSHHVLSVDDWPGDATFFLRANLWRLSASIQSKKRSSPLDFIFDTCASASSSHFFGWWSWTCVSVPFCKDNCIFSNKTCVLQFGRVDTKFLNSSHHVLSVDDWPGDATFFLWANLWKLSASIQSKKGPAPWILFLTPAPRPLEVTFLVGEAEHVCLYPFAKSCKESYPLN